MTSELTPVDYVYLVILEAEDREIDNTEMNELYGVRLTSPDYQRLNADGYVVSKTKPAPYRHVITKKGSRALADPLTVDQSQVKEREKRSSGERQLLWAGMLAQQKLIARLSANKTSTTTVVEEPIDLDGRIRAAYRELAAGPGDYVNLTELRPLVGEVSKGELDKALLRLHDAPDVRLEPEPFGHRIGAKERSAAIHIGGEDRHKLAIGRP